MIDVSAEEFLKELNAKRAHRDSWPLFAGLTAFVAGSAFVIGTSPWMWLGAGVLGTAVSFWRYERDQVDRLTVSMYELDDEYARTCGELYAVFEQLCRCAVWHISSEVEADPRRSAGAMATTERKPIWPKLGTGPRFLRTNVPVPQIPVGRQTLHFLPERLLVEADEGIGAVHYADLIIDVQAEDYVESDDMPTDAHVVRKSWKYQKQDGGPDLRFKDNRELPTMRYERIHFKSASGLNEMIQVSRVGIGEQLGQSLVRLGRTDK